ncbi:TRAP transporter large permease [Inquilinus limosus]|uniref:TRAP transporter large permease protein n=1 Tax=Inquilinus limosus TaxID=171674 RepID=A0A211ZF55_9PROT|nr:TRAP transporter large permease [Inquilinus limosus]OWJ63747.1 C4-dicarboxylate ABC transporter [Inquilinus limosus]
MAATLLFAPFVTLLVAGAPIFLALAVGAIAAIAYANLGMDVIPLTIHSAVAKYPLLAAPMFILTGSILERSGVAVRLLNLASAIVGRGPGSLAAIAVVLAMLMGGISGSAVAIAATVAGIMTPSMVRAGYPRGFIATVVGAAAATDILVPPSISLIVYSVLVPAASVPAMFAAGIIPGTLAGIALIGPVYLVARKHGFGGEGGEPRPAFWPSLVDASWGLIAKVIILVGLRFGWFTPTEAGVIAVAYSLFVGLVVYRSISLRDCYEMLVESAELTAVIFTVIAFAGLFGWAMSTIGIVAPLVQWVAGLPIGEYGILAMVILLMVAAGMFLEGMSTFLILLPVLTPIAQHFRWDPVWFGVILTLKIAIGQFTPPLAVNLMVTARIAQVPVQSTFRWVWLLIATMLLVLVAVIAFPDLALWLPRWLEIQ